MAKVLFKREKRAIDDGRKKKVILEKQRFYYVKDPSKEFMTEHGAIAKKELKKKDGSMIKSNTGESYSLFSAGFSDDFKKIERNAQIITLKDIGAIITETGIGKDSVVIDAGTGSGALACYLAHVCKEVISYDIREDATKIGQKNKELLGLGNLKLKTKDICKKIDEKNVDVIILDMPDPWNALSSTIKALKTGGYLVVYVPTVLQIVDFMMEAEKREELVHLKTTEVIQRNWKIEGRIARPNFDALGHTGFLTFVRKIK